MELHDTQTRRSETQQSLRLITLWNYTTLKLGNREEKKIKQFDYPMELHDTQTQIRVLPRRTARFSKGHIVLESLKTRLSSCILTEKHGNVN